MTSARLDAQPAAWAESSALAGLFTQTAAIAEVELKKVLRDPTELFTRAVQPVLWLVVFGQVLVVKSIFYGFCCHPKYFAAAVSVALGKETVKSGRQSPWKHPF